MSAPLDPRTGLFSCPLERAPSGRSLSLHHRPRSRGAASSLFRRISSALSRTKKSDSFDSAGEFTDQTSGRLSVEGAVDDSDSLDPASCHNVQWAQGKAGEDRVHVVVSEEHGWVFVGIYDGLNGPDATDFLLSNLYSAMERELEGYLWEDKFESQREPPSDDAANTHGSDASISTTWVGENGRRCMEASKKRRRFRGAANKWEEKQRRWKCEWDRERLELERRLMEQFNWTSSGSNVEVGESGGPG